MPIYHLCLAFFVVQFVLAPAIASAQATYHVLHTFTGLDGSEPRGALLRDRAGNLYGTTYMGGSFGAGTVFKLDTKGTETVLYSFTGGTDGGYPTGGLINDASHNLYGTTPGGGTFNFGTVFKLDSAGRETVLYNFTGGADGAWPSATLVRDVAGNFLSTAPGGGDLNCDSSLGCGTVFRLDAAGKLTVLHTFKGFPLDGADPNSGLILDAKGNLYGDTIGGGSANVGTVFS